MGIPFKKIEFQNGQAPAISDENLNAMQDNAENAVNIVAEAIGNNTDTYDSTLTYTVDDLVIYGNKIYKCITEITESEAFDSTKWENINLMDIIQNANSGQSSGENRTILYSDETGTTGQNSLTLSDNYNNYTDLEIVFDICMESGTKKYFGITQKVNIEKVKSEIILGFMCSLPIYATFDLTNNTNLTITRNRICTAWNAPGEGNYLYITKVVGIKGD